MLFNVIRIFLFVIFKTVVCSWKHTLFYMKYWIAVFDVLLSPTSNFKWW